MLLTIRHWAVILFLYPALSSVGAFAFCPVPKLRANGEFFKADLIFSGTVLSKRYAPGRDTEIGDDSGWYYRVRVSQSFKGSVPQEIQVYTMDASNRFPLAKGHDYLLFAYRSHHRWEIDSCGNSAELSAAANSIAAIQNIARSQDGEIEGWIGPETEGVELSGIHVVIRGRSQIYRTVTDKDGYFQFRAPAGKYVVDFQNHEYYVNKYDEFWYGPRHFIVHLGETVSLQLVSVRHSKT